MNKLLSAFILAAFLFINTASAATWVEIGTNTKDEVWYYDADSVIRDESGFYSLRLAYRKPGNKKWQESELSTGDYMMVVKNNYHWLPDESKAGFIANGDIIELLKVGTVKEQYGFRFADARIRMVDYPEEQPIEVKLLLDTIAAETPALTSEQNKKLYEGVLADHMDIADKSKRFIKVKKDPFFNALQVKFAYAITCHKAQGGQWETVFVDQGYLTKEMINTEFLRWLYTAVTRASEKLYLVNFNKEFFAEE